MTDGEIVGTVSVKATNCLKNIHSLVIGLSRWASKARYKICFGSGVKHSPIIYIPHKSYNL